MFRVCHTVLSVHCSLVLTCWERASLLDLMYVTFSCVFVTFPCDVLDQVWYLIVSIPDLCLLTFIAGIYGCGFLPEHGCPSIVITWAREKYRCSLTHLSQMNFPSSIYRTSLFQIGIFSFYSKVHRIFCT